LKAKEIEHESQQSKAKRKQLLKESLGEENVDEEAKYSNVIR
jgi:hypothetical protein